MLASSPAMSDNFVEDAPVLSWRTTANRPRGVHRSLAPSVLSKLAEKLPIIDPYASEPISSSNPTQLMTGSSILASDVTDSTEPVPGPPSAEWFGIEPFLVGTPPYWPHGCSTGFHGWSEVLLETTFDSR